jgi:hypothetical protein
MTSFRLDTDIVTALRKRAGERGESLSDVMRSAALLILGYCPTCQRKVETDNDDSDRADADGGQPPAPRP